MQALANAIQQMIQASEEELEYFLSLCFRQAFARKEILSQPGPIADRVFFVEQGLIRVKVNDLKGTEHTIHFALENQFIADYSSFLMQTPAVYTLEALETTQTIVLPKPAIDWGYQEMEEGNKLGRLVAEGYFVYLDSRVKSMHTHSPKERYDSITQVFPNIHNRVPQHMIASYLGISPVHLSRLKKADT